MFFPIQFQVSKLVESKNAKGTLRTPSHGVPVITPQEKQARKMAPTQAAHCPHLLCILMNAGHPVEAHPPVINIQPTPAKHSNPLD